MKAFKLTFVAILTITSCSLSATELYHLTFSGNDTGSYQVDSGNPLVQPSAGAFTDALVFHCFGFDSGSPYDVIQLPLPASQSRFDIQFDILTHNLMNSQHAFFLYLDTLQVPYVCFHGGQNSINAFQPSPYTTANLAVFNDDRPYHFDISVDLPANRWSVSLDGTQLYENLINASSMESLRFSAQPWTGWAVDAPATYIALDNVIVSIVPEPSVFSLLILAGLAVAILTLAKNETVFTVQQAGRRPCRDRVSVDNRTTSTRRA